MDAYPAKLAIPSCILAPPESIRPIANKSYNGQPTTLTAGWNTPYATRMHENYPADPKDAPHSKNDPGAGGKWLENHIDADKKDLMKVIAHTFGKELGTL